MIQVIDTFADGKNIVETMVDLCLYHIRSRNRYILAKSGISQSDLVCTKGGVTILTYYMQFLLLFDHMGLEYV